MGRGGARGVLAPKPTSQGCCEEDRLWVLKCFANCLVLCERVLLLLLTVLITIMMKELLPCWALHWLCLDLVARRQILIPRSGLYPLFISLPPERDLLGGKASPLFCPKRGPGSQSQEKEEP